jgi:hypothetical protein
MIVDINTIFSREVFNQFALASDANSILGKQKTEFPSSFIGFD